MGRSDSRTGAPTHYLFSADADLSCHPVSLCGPLMLLNGLSDRAVLFHPGEPAACFWTLLGRQCWLRHLWKVGHSRFA